MKTKMVLTWWLVILLFFLTPNKRIQAQVSGCPPSPLRIAAAQYQVIEVIPLLAEPILEAESAVLAESFEKVPGFTDSQRVPFSYSPSPTQRVILSSTPDGAGFFCTDDKVRLVSSAGLVFEHDFRSQDRAQIVPLEPVDVTALLAGEGDVWVEIKLFDLTGPNFSSSPYYLVIIDAASAVGIPPAAEVYMERVAETNSTAKVRPPTQTAPTPALMPTEIPTATPTNAPTSEMVTESWAAPTATQPEAALPAEFPTLYILIALEVLLGAGILTLLIHWFINRPRLIGNWVIKYKGNFWRIVDLAAYGSKITFGRKGHLKPDDDNDEQDLPPIAVQLVARRGTQGQMQVVWQEFEDGRVVEELSHPLAHGDVKVIGSYELTYENFTQPEVIDELLDGGIWNEI